MVYRMQCSTNCVIYTALAKAAEDEDLKQAFTSHLAHTRGQVDRLKTVFELLDEKPTDKHCKGMEGLVKEGQE